MRYVLYEAISYRISTPIPFSNKGSAVFGMGQRC